MKFISTLKYVVFCFFMLQMVAQTPKKDLTELPYDSIRDLFFGTINKTLKLQYANAYLIKAKKENIEIRIAKGYFFISKLNQSEKALSYLDSAVKFSKNSKDMNFPCVAYSEKGQVYRKMHKTKESLENFFNAEKYAKINNLDLYYNQCYNIAIEKSEELGEVVEAMILYKKCLKYYKTKEFRNPKYSFDYQNILFSLADSYKALNQNDSATYYNNKGYLEAKITKNDLSMNLFILNEGATQVQNKNYKVAIDSINKALPKMIFYKNQGNTLAGYYYLGKAYNELKDREKAKTNFLKVDSIYKASKNITPEFVSGYPVLISYYKNNGNKVKQLEYLTTYMKIDSTLAINYKQVENQIEKGYDIPNLLKEKENLIKSLKKDNKKSSWGLIGLFFLLITAAGFGYRQHQLKKTYKLRFQKIIEATKAETENKNLPLQNDSETLTNKTDDLGIAPELVEAIRKKLLLFENDKDFLRPTLTLQLLSQEFDTNTKYLSKIINECKGKPFITYINDLRIDYCVLALQRDLKLRKYTIQALSQEFGFNTAESFSTTFFKKTGLKPSFFIKELENI
jgi:AraC-like DNA-binding protein